MDILEKEIKIKCSIHPNNRVEYFQIKEIKEDKNLFYCKFCQNEDEDYKTSNYLLIDKILECKPNQAIDKWPPLSDNSLHKKIQQYTQQKNKEPSLTFKIEAFFESLKQEVLRNIDQVQKKMINYSQSLHQNSNSIHQNSNSILQKYLELSKSNTLIQILNDQSTDNKQKQNKFRELLKQLESQKLKNSEIFEQIIKKHEQNESLIDFETPNKLKGQILNIINQINIFTLEKTQFDEIYNEQNRINEQEKKSKLLFDLISTKSNFCSQKFLTSIQQLFNQISPLIQKMSFDDVFIQNKSQIDFSELNDNQIEMISEFSQHFTILSKKQQEQINNMKNNQKIKEIIKMLNQKENNVNEDFLKDFENYLIESFPILNKLNFDKIFKENVYEQQYLNQIQIAQSQQQNMKKNEKQIDILPSIQMIKTNYEQSQEQLKIVKDEQNNSISISLSYQTIYFTNCVSDIILDQNTSYVFRFQVINHFQTDKYAFIGLIRDSQKHINAGFNVNLSCYFKFNSKQLSCGGYNGIDLKEKGDFVLKSDCIIEMRVCVREGILKMLDYPNYNHILSLQHKYKSKLQEYKDLRLYFGLGFTDLNFQLIYAQKQINH